jgi:hypothetical protein
MSESKRKLGEGHVAGMARLGLKELTHNILPAFPHQGQHVIEEPGIFGNPTQGEVAQARKNFGAGLEQESPAAEMQPQKKYTLDELRGYAQERAKNAGQQMEHGNEQHKDKEHDKGIER